MALSSSFANHLAPGFRDFVGLEFKTYEAAYSKFFNVESSSRAYEDYLHAAGIPFAIARNEGEPTPFFDPLEGTTKRYTHTQFAVGVQITKEAWDDDLYKAKSALRKAARSLTRSMTERVEIQAADVFNNGFTAAGASGTYNTIDGVGFFNTQHKKLTGTATYEGTGTISNRGADSDLGLSTLRALLTIMRKWTDDRGYKLNYQPDTLVIPIDSEFYAAELFGSRLDPDTTNNRVNIHYNQLQIEPWMYLTDTDAWFLKCKEHHLYFLWRERPTMDSYDDKNTRTAKFASFMRFSRGPLHYIGWAGASG